MTEVIKGAVMRKVLILVTLVLFGSAAGAQQALYWIPDVGCTLTRGTSDLSYTLSAEEPLRLFLDYDTGWERHSYARDGEDDLCWSRTDWFDPAYSHDEQQNTFTPPVKVVDYPLIAGRTWQTTSAWRTTTHSLVRTCVVTGTVIGPRVLDTRIGTLDVIEITLAFDYDAGPNDFMRTFFLHEVLGDVSDLLAIEDCTVVTTEPATWSRVKALHH